MAKPNKADLRIGKIPDLTPVKMTISVDPETHHMLEDYARLHTESYGDPVKPAALVPLMISGFLATDNGFKRARRALSNT